MSILTNRNIRKSNRAFKPNYYVKGQDYKTTQKDITETFKKKNW